MRVSRHSRRGWSTALGQRCADTARNQWRRAEENLALPVLSVGQLVDLIASGRVDGRAIAVGGYWADPGPVPCPYRPDEGFGNDCGLRVLMETDQKLGSSTGNGSSWGAPEPPFIRPYTMETTGLTSVTVDMSNGDPFVRPARRVVVIGHVGDPRAYGCTLTTVDDCRHRFVVDRVTWVDGKDVDLTAQFDPYVVRPTMTEADAIAAVESASPAGSPPLVVLGTTAAEAARVDPRIRVGVDGAVWIGQSLVGDPDADGTSTITETVVDDATGAVLQKRPLAVDPGYAPAVLTLVDDHGGEGNPDTGFVAVDLPDGTPLLTGSAGSFVVDAGDYSLRAWLAR